jgi:hypothetical protein
VRPQAPPGPLARRRTTISVSSGRRLAYRYEVEEDRQAPGAPKLKPTGYEMDLLVADELDEGRWVPRVVLKCKLGGITTHDALAYSAKAGAKANACANAPSPTSPTGLPIRSKP